MRFLLFTLYAPMGALGEIAVGERRMGWARPARSAVLGLVAAAMGIERGDEKVHQELQEGLYFAVRIDAPGRPFVDYHTTQTPKARKGRKFRTRREELKSGDINTILSRREWRSDAFFTVSLWPRRESAANIDKLASSLRHPGFVLYLGRKSAPLGLPLNPVIVDAETFMTAFSSRKRTDEERYVLETIRKGDPGPSIYAFDYGAPGSPPDFRVERRRDMVASRVRWQFADRSEGVIEHSGGEQ